MTHDTRHPGGPLAATLVSLACVLGPGGIAAGQVLGGEPTELSELENLAPPEPPAGDETAMTGPVRRIPATLIREGSHLVRVTGRLRRDVDRGTWTFLIEPAPMGGVEPELTLMPGMLLAEMERMVESSNEHDLVFEMTGEVFVYRERNYLMPTHPPLLIGHELRVEVVEDVTEEDATEDDSPLSEGDTTDDIIRDLERSVGPVARRAAGRRPAFSVDTASTSDMSAIPEGTTVLDRRGVIRRTGQGAYVFVFDADAEGQGDPPMRLLPCLLLERLEEYARRAGEKAAVLLSGQVYAYHRQNYLRVTVYRIPHERTRLKP